MNRRRPWLIPLTPLYHLVVASKRRMYDWGWLKRRRLTAPVISIGSISAGGAGKTPFAVMLAQLLHGKGYKVNILTRGYGRVSEVVERVEPYDDPRWHGDEPVLLAQQSGAEVFAAVERYEAGVMAERENPHGQIVVHLLDDGFQHLRLARNVDIVLLTVEDAEDALLPAGNLRESLATVGRADIVVVRQEEAERLREELEELRGERNFAVWVIRRSLQLLDEETTIMPARTLAFCGIARPENFTEMLDREGHRPVETVPFADHHPFTEADVRRLVERARQLNADGFVTTEKDAVKLTPELRALLEEVGPVMVARLKVELFDEKTALGQLIALVSEMDRRKDRSLFSRPGWTGRAQ